MDPDKNYFCYLDHFGCNYYQEDDFNQLVSSQSNHDNFSIVHINARSLNKNIGDIITYLNLLQHQFTVITISETWITDLNEGIIHLPGYTSYLKNRKSTSGGGVAIFVLENVDSIVRKDITIDDRGNM